MPPSTSSPRVGPARIAVGPGEVKSWIEDAIVAGGGQIVRVAEAEALVWTDPRDATGLAEVLAGDDAEGLEWIQLPWAGIERFVHLVDHERRWTCGKGVYAEPVAELALALALAGLRHVVPYSRAAGWTAQAGRNLRGAHVTILGGGGITESLLRLLAPFECRTTVVRKNVASMDGADDVLEAERYIDALPGADVVVLALALTPETRGIIGRSELELMDDDAWLVNVARGEHVVTDDLVWALGNGVIGGAALDVTDPEPLPDGHPLWSAPNCIITPHVGNTAAMAVPLLSERITANVERFLAGEELIGPVDPADGY